MKVIYFSHCFKQTIRLKHPFVSEIKCTETYLNWFPKQNIEFDLNSIKIKQYGIACNDLVSEKFQLIQENTNFFD